MILGIHPEDRDGRDVVLRSNALGELNSSECLQQRKERSAEEPRLLARDDGHRGGIAKDGCGCKGNGRRTAALLLRLKHLDDGVALPVVTGCACDGVAPRDGIARIAGKEVRQARVVERVVRRQPSDPREPTNIDGNAAARGWRPPVRRWGTWRSNLCGTAPFGTFAERRAQCQENRVRMLRSVDSMNAILALEDGTWYRGVAAGAPGEAAGEVVFNTSMTGYQEVLTDPSYAGQIVTMTAPQIGNYGVAAGDAESQHAAGGRLRHARGVADRQQLARRRHAARLPDAHSIVAIADIDTRALTRVLRSAGVMRGVIATGARSTRRRSWRRRGRSRRWKAPTW